LGNQSTAVIWSNDGGWLDAITCQPPIIIKVLENIRFSSFYLMTRTLSLLQQQYCAIIGNNSSFFRTLLRD
jgi:hypothetical protein